MTARSSESSIMGLARAQFAWVDADPPLPPPTGLGFFRTWFYKDVAPMALQHALAPPPESCESC